MSTERNRRNELALALLTLGQYLRSDVKCETYEILVRRAINAATDAGYSEGHGAGFRAGVAQEKARVVALRRAARNRMRRKDKP